MIIRFPLQASQALNTNSKFILNHIFDTQDLKTTVKPEALDQLLKFFENKNEINIVLSGYVSEFISKLMEVNYYEVCKYLFENPLKLASITQHLYDSSICKDIFIPIIFKPDRDMDMENSVLEKKLEIEQIDKFLRPQRIKLFKDTWNRYYSFQDVDSIINLLKMFKEVVARQSKDENYKAFLHETLYNKEIVNSLFQFMLNAEVN